MGDSGNSRIIPNVSNIGNTHNYSQKEYNKFNEISTRNYW